MKNSENVKHYDRILSTIHNSDWGQIEMKEATKLCDGNEGLAEIIAEELESRGFISLSSCKEGVTMMLSSKGKAKLFEEQGGFTAELKKQIAKEEEDSELKKLQKENLQLQNENLEHSKIIRKQEQDIRDLDKKLKVAELYKLAFAFGGGVAGYLLKLFF